MKKIKIRWEYTLQMRGITKVWWRCDLAQADWEQYLQRNVSEKLELTMKVHNRNIAIKQRELSSGRARDDEENV